MAAAACAGALAACGVPALGGTDEPKGGGRAPVPVNAKGECTGVPAPGDSRARQLRAMWIATVAGIDWPKDSDKTPEQQKAGYRRLLDTAQAMNLNAVFVQIRPNSDAFYKSPYEPWSQWITGTPGKDPGYDVLDFMVKESKARNLEFHAWFNPYRVSRQSDLKKLAPTSPARRNPGWVRKYGAGLWYDPGLPEVRDLATKAVLDVVAKYDIDAVHFDDYFYPYPESGEFPDGATFKTYGKGMKRDDWRRQNVDTLVRDLSRRIHQAKPWMRFGISPFGVWRNKRTDPAGSDTTALQSYDDIYGDTRKWIKQGWIDYVTPQLYWPIGDKRADYATLVKWWAGQVEGTKVQLSIGQAGYRVGEDAAWKRPEELSKHLTLNAKYPQVRGDVYFSATNLAANKLGFAARLRDDHYSRPAIPPMGRGGREPAAIQALETGAEAKGVRVQWRPAQGADAYAVYRADGKRPGCAPVDPGTLVATVRGGGIIDPSAKAGKTYTYYVTALDRTHRESPPGRGSTVTAGRG
ncbi:glycoside hydrolase family 10 protein [Spirillospora sp. CA-294931]|uniref:glycoside hydrolase family 10 protein n=1 Tax=Spirillospora sp. CA-294931 TaxID=3240042 RepID=UPI003D94E773